MLNIAAFYKFVTLENYVDMREPLLDVCSKLSIKGTILLAEEGINSTIAGSEDAIREFFEFLRTDDRFSDVSPSITHSTQKPFQRLKVKLKREIVTFGIDGLSVEDNGKKLSPYEWNKLINDKNTLLFDTRNIYETKMGTFNNAIIPNTQNFRDFPEWFNSWLETKHGINKEDVNVAMFCTGGVRCEKSTKLLKHIGFKNVYHLEGGIINYLKNMKKEDSVWQGKCFIFDDRVSLEENLAPAEQSCINCGNDVQELIDVSKAKIICNNCKTEN